MNVCVTSSECVSAVGARACAPGAGVCGAGRSTGGGRVLSIAAASARRAAAAAAGGLEDLITTVASRRPHATAYDYAGAPVGGRRSLLSRCTRSTAPNEANKYGTEMHSGCSVPPHNI
ncbi:hypothetical protein EVAR_32473_1 [Eumeta japonica]|uniref:Uncharacterized protein n=1 Tax=Eumeta variegata TaxID=151549 RepID=A0A4C1VN09_EUMVA|nr:hypothetical protein EVAR_32473_1 [Eumeta japonica]